MIRGFIELLTAGESVQSVRYLAYPLRFEYGSDRCKLVCPFFLKTPLYQF